ncbi:hypothetical protein BCR32DRAFT_300942 [Anaeromyces robustus]|uniref:Uncharacterized protein n=1 Tax=Anaeromyces robustus TaxID=1754192 RepID=A0A1Y1X0M2_9FUNG|nr:hypothetical protein BCR32DRAFT_300942 [Anaeromyces robustus]|eukprot:ORX79357.1 hypothetical protein BCR32DRAFT_300942 [Anaeromyces robustus]
MDEIKEIIIKFIKSNNTIELENYITKKNIELKILNNENFDIMNYAHSLKKEGKISHDMLKSVSNHIDRIRNIVVNIIKKNDLNKLKRYVIENDIEFKNLNYSHLDIINYILYKFKNGKVSDELKDYVVFNYDKKRSKVMNLIIKDNIPELKNYLRYEKIELKSLNDNYFDIIKYCLSRKLKVSVRMRNFVISHFDQKRSNIVEYIRLNDTKKLNKYIRENEIELNMINDNYFNLLTYCHDERHHISSQMKEFVIQNYYNHRRKVITMIKYPIFLKLDILQIIERKNLDELKRYKHKNIDEFKEINDDYFDIMKYCYNEDHQVPNNIKNYITLHFTEKRNSIIKQIQKNNIGSLIKYLVNNYFVYNDRFYFDDLDDEYFKIIDYCKSDNHISTKMVDYIINHYNKNRSCIIESIRNKNKKKLKNYIDEYKIEIKSINDDYFNIFNYCRKEISNKDLYSEMKIIMLKNYDKLHQSVITLLEDDLMGREKSKNYLNEQNLEYKDLNDQYFNIID